jgi:hypothetical protein
VGPRVGLEAAEYREISLRALFATCFTLTSFLAYSSILKMEATCSSETSIEFRRTTRRNIPQDRTLRH